MNRAPARAACSTLLALLFVALPATAGQDPASPLGPSFDLEEWRDLPSSHGVWSLFENVEATTITDRIDNGGLFTGDPALLGVHGSTWTQVSYRLGGLDITDPDRTGTPLLLADRGVLRGVDARTGLLPVEEGGGPGAVVSLQPRRAGDAWHGALGGDFVPTGWQGSSPDEPPPVARYASFSSARLSLDGPLVKDRLGLFLSGAFTRAERLPYGEATRLAGRDAGVLAHLVWTPSPRDDVRFLGALEAVTRPYGGRVRFGAGDASESDRFAVGQATWQRRSPLPWELSAGYARGAFDPDLEGRDPNGAVERLRDGPVPLLFPGSGTRGTGTLAARVSPVAKGWLGADHAFRFGLTATRATSSTRPAGSPGLTAETVDGLAARVWDYGWAGPESRWRSLDLAAYAADSLTRGRASFDLGLRFDSTSGSAESGSGRIDWRGLSPRLHARVRLTADGAWSLFGGYARYRHRLPLSLLAFGDPTAAQGAVYRWLDGNGDRVFQADERGPLVARVGPGGSYVSIDPGLAAPHTDEVAAGLQLRFGGAWSAHLVGIYRREHDLVAAINVGAPASAYTVDYVRDPGVDILGSADDQLLPIYDRRPETFGQDLYTLANHDDARHEGVEAAIQGTVGERLRLLLGGTASRSVGPAANRGFRVFENDQGLPGERLEDPNATTFARGRLFFDRAYTLKLAASYRAPGETRLGLVARYQDGQPFARLVIAPLLQQGPEAVAAFPSGASRFTYTLTVDARAEKGLRLARLRLAAVLEAFNLLNLANEVEEYVVTGPAFRTVTAVQPPRAFRLGLRLEF